MKRFIVGFIPLSFMVGLPTIAGRMAWACLCCLRRDCIRRVPCLRHSRYDGSGFQHGGSFRMQPREQFDTGVDAGRNDAALKRAEPGRGGRGVCASARRAAWRPCSLWPSPRSLPCPLRPRRRPPALAGYGIMKRNTPLFFTLFTAIVFCATVSQNVFAKTESSRLYLKSGLEVKKQPVVEEDPVLSAHDGLGVLVRADCYAGQTVHSGESCTYPGAASLIFSVSSSGGASFGFFNVSSNTGTISALNTTINGISVNFLAMGNGDGSWFLQEVGDDVAGDGGRHGVGDGADGDGGGRDGGRLHGGSRQRADG